jgi:hypothetical protein
MPERGDGFHRPEQAPSPIHRFPGARSIRLGVMKLPVHPEGVPPEGGERRKEEDMGKDIAAAEVTLVGATASGLTVVPELAGVVGEGRGTDGTDLVIAERGTGGHRPGERGMVSAEWAVGIVAAVAIAGVLLAVITSGEVQDALLKFLLWVIKTFVSVVE